MLITEFFLTKNEPSFYCKCYHLWWNLCCISLYVSGAHIKSYCTYKWQNIVFTDLTKMCSWAKIHFMKKSWIVLNWIRKWPVKVQYTLLLFYLNLHGKLVQIYLIFFLPLNTNADMLTYWWPFSLFYNCIYLNEHFYVLHVSARISYQKLYEQTSERLHVQSGIGWSSRNYHCKLDQDS